MLSLNLKTHISLISPFSNTARSAINLFKSAISFPVSSPHQFFNEELIDYPLLQVVRRVNFHQSTKITIKRNKQGLHVLFRSLQRLSMRRLRTNHIPLLYFFVDIYPFSCITSVRRNILRTLVNRKNYLCFLTISTSGITKPSE